MSQLILICGLLGVSMCMIPHAAPSTMHAQMGHAAQVSGVAHLVGVQRAVQNNGNINSEPKYLACEESPVHAFYC